MKEETDADYGISFSDIVWRLWDWRGLIVLVPLLCAGIAALVVLVSVLAQDRLATYLISLRNIENQRYPNGAEFSPRDLLIPEVIAQLRSRHDVESASDLRDAVSVVYDSPLAEGIAQKYQQRLSARNLTQAEIDSLNQRYLEDLRNAMRSSLRITVDYGSLGLDSSAGQAIAAELPGVWSSVYTTKYRIFTDSSLADLAVTRSQEDLSDTGSIITANARVEAMDRGLQTFLEDNRFAMLRTADGLSAADMRIELNNFRSIWFNPLKAYTLGAAADTIASSYLDELGLNIAEKRREVESFTQTLAGLNQFQGSSRTDTPAAQPPSVQGNQPNTVQVGDSAFSGIVELAQQASFASFVERILDERREAMVELAAMEKERDFALNTAEGTIPPEFRTQASQVLSEVTGHYSQLLDDAEALMRNRAGDLFEPLLGPVLSGGKMLSLRSALFIVAAGLAGGLAVVIGVLVAGSVRPREGRGKAA